MLFCEEQFRNNMLCFLEDREYAERKEVFFRLMRVLEERRVKWAVGCSLDLFFRGLTDEFHDFDLIVDEGSIPAVKKIMQELDAELVSTGGNGFCESDVYMNFHVGRVDVDVISGFRVVTFNTQYYYRYDESEIDYIKVEKIKIPLISLEAMYILYYMMEGWQPKRKFKRKLIEEFFKENRPEHPQVFEKALKANLPGWIRWEIKKYL